MIVPELIKSLSFSRLLPHCHSVMKCGPVNRNCSVRVNISVYFSAS